MSEFIPEQSSWWAEYRSKVTKIVGTTALSLTLVSCGGSPETGQPTSTPSVEAVPVVNETPISTEIPPCPLARLEDFDLNKDDPNCSEGFPPLICPPGDADPLCRNEG